jgi:E3 ubiquitin-protein ligase SlrP
MESTMLPLPASAPSTSVGHAPALAAALHAPLQATFAGAANLPAAVAREDARRAPPSPAAGCFDGAWRRVRDALAGVRLLRTSACDRALAAWARSGAATERRAEAVERIHAFSRSRRHHALDLHGLFLRELPPLPDRLRRLDCSHNLLRRVPEFPASMEALVLSGNPLDAWPVLPPRLESLEIARCRLTDMGALPRSLYHLNIGHNRIAQLPSELPPGMVMLSAEGNRLTHLPAGMGHLPALSWVMLHGNPLAPGTLAQIEEWNRWFASPHTFMTGSLAEARRVDALPEVDELRHVEQMDALDPEEAFERFRARLERSVNAREQPMFMTEFLSWSRRVEQDPALRAATHAIALAATATCEDRVTLTYLAMRRAELTLAIDAGRHDADAGQLVAMLRHLMREEAVDRIALDRIARSRNAEPARHVDEIETILHYRVGMGALLPQAGAVREGRFTLLAGVTDAELEEARGMLERLDAGFPRYLSNLPLWHGVLERWHPDAFAAARERRAELGDPEAYADRVRAYLRAEQPGLEDDVDAQVNAGPEVLARLNHEVFWPLAQQFLRERGVSLD